MMKRLLLLCMLASVLTGCATTDQERIDEANEFCGFRGYKYIKIYYYYGEVDEIYCSINPDANTQPVSPLANPEVPHE